MPKIVIPQEDIDKLMQEVNAMSDEEVEALAGTYQKRLTNTWNKTPEAKQKQRMAQAVRRKKMRLLVDRAIQMGLLKRGSMSA